jgi:AraC-like DNA-binding protein
MPDGAKLGENGYPGAMPKSPPEELTTARTLARGEGWRVDEVVCRAGPGDPTFEERHDGVSIAAVMSGTFTYRSDRGRALLAPGALLIGNAGACFECGHEHAPGDRCIAFHLSPELVEQVAGSLTGARRASFTAASIPPLETLLPLFAAIPRTADYEGLALEVAATALSLDQDAATRPADARETARASAAARLIETRYAEPLTVASLAREVDLSPRRFTTAFREGLGVTPYNYILRCRLDAAARRLLDDAESVLDIALGVGFGDLSEFTRRFRDRFGLPPAAFRRSYGPARSGL